jgi:hypothetical protein
MNHDRDKVFEKRISKLRGAPDRRDWDDVTRLATAAGYRPAEAPIRRRLFGMVLGASGAAGLAAILVLLFVALPKDSTTSPAATIDRLPSVPFDQVPSNVANRPATSPGGGQPLAVAKLLTTTTSTGEYTVWRIAYATEYYDAVYGPDGARSGSEGCFINGGVVPEDPPGTPDRVVVPDLHGLPLGEARARLAELGLVLGRVVDIDRSGMTDDSLVTGRTAQTGVPTLRGSVVDVSASNEATDSTTSTAPDLRYCQSGGGGGETSDLLFGVSPRVASVAAEWPGGTRDEAVVQNRIAFLRLSPNDCAHPDPPQIVARDSNGNELLRLTGTDDDSRYSLGQWEAAPSPACGDPRPAPRFDEIVSRLSVLRSDPTVDRLTDETKRRLLALPASARPTAVKRAAVINGVTLFVGTTQASGAESICLVDVQVRSLGGSEDAISCVPPNHYSTEFLLTERNLRETTGGTRADVLGLVLDGYDTATVDGNPVRVENNVFLIPDVQYNAEVTLTGPAGRISARPRGRTGGRLEPPRVPLR